MFYSQKLLAPRQERVEGMHMGMKRREGAEDHMSCHGGHTVRCMVELVHESLCPLRKQHAIYSLSGDALPVRSPYLPAKAVLPLSVNRQREEVTMVVEVGIGR